MKKRQARNRLIGVQIAGFAALISLVWLDDIFDLPALFGASIETVMLVQTIVVSALSAALCMWLVTHTHRVLQRLKDLEGLLPVCSFCKKIRVETNWVPIEDYVAEHSAAEFTHTFCPECGRANYGEFLKEK
jgi:hypothetical protein